MVPDEGNSLGGTPRGAHCTRADPGGFSRRCVGAGAVRTQLVGGAPRDPHPPAKAWRALTTPDPMAPWLMPNDFEPVVGRRFTFRASPIEATNFSGTIACQVLEVGPMERLQITWRDADGINPLDSTVTFQLCPEGRGTRLILEHNGFDPDDPGQQMARRIMSSGWRGHVLRRLGALLDPQEDASAARWLAPSSHGCGCSHSARRETTAGLGKHRARYGNNMVGILTRDSGQPWRSPDTFAYESEDALQDLLATHPSLIPGVSGAARTVRELQSGVGPADVVAVDNEGALTVVECKLAANQQIRREIVGQVFDYAARLSKMPIEEFEGRWRKRTGQELFGPDDAEARTALADNLAEGRFRLVLAVDEVNSTLRDIVEFISSTLRPETALVVIEYRRWRDGTQEILVPQMYGRDLQPIEAVPVALTPKKAWTLDEFLTWVRNNDPAAISAASAIASTLTRLGSRYKAGNGKNPSGFFITVAANGLAAKPFYFWVMPGSGARLEVNFDPSWTNAWRLDPQAWSCVEAMLDDFEALPELSSAVRSIRESDLMNRPSVPLNAISTETTEKISRVLNTFSKG